jgi:anti-sigma B factor antagonist
MEQMEVIRDSGATGSTAIIRLKGPLTLATLFTLQSVLREIPDSDTIIDVTDAPYIDSAGLGTILSHWSHTQRTGHRFALTGASPRINILLEITKVNAVLPLFATAEAAERSFKGKTATA